MTQFILTLSPAGSGKTTLIANCIRSWQKSIAVIFNDDGTQSAVDFPTDVDQSNLVTMTNGCFGCRDADELKRTMLLLDGKFDIVFIEPIGFTAAGEMLNVFGKAKIVPIVITLLDAENIERNHSIGTLSGQLAAADIVVVTKLNDSNEYAAKAYSQRFVHKSTIVVELSATETLPVGTVNEVVTRWKFSLNKIHSHLHIVTRHHRLKPNTNIHELTERLKDAKVIRAKGIVGDQRFDFVWGDTFFARGENPFNWITFYTKNEEDAVRADEAITSFILQDRFASLGTADEVRDQLPGLDFLLEVIERCENAELTFDSNGLPVAHTEDQELLNELRKRQGVPEKLMARGVRARVNHFLKCGEWLENNTSAKPSSSLLLSLSIGIAWFCSEQPERITNSMIGKAQSLPLMNWLARALLGREKTNGDLAREEVIAEEAGITLRYSLQCRHDEADIAQMRLALDHSLILANIDGREAIITAWNKLEA